MPRTAPLPELSIATAKPGLTRGQWLVLAAAFLGWMFDGVEQGLFPIAARSAFLDLMPGAAEEAIGRSISYLVACFLAGAALGGIIFGWMGDRFGRVRTMALTIFAYSLFMGCCYFVPLPLGRWIPETWQPLGIHLHDVLGSGRVQLSMFQFLAALGMGGEWALGVALIMECWPERLRPILAGVIGAASNVGFLLIALLGVFIPIRPQSWRWIMLAGASPALLALLVLAFVPESQRWKESVRGGGGKPMREILTTRLLWRTLLATAFASVALIGTWGAVSSFLPTWADHMVGRDFPRIKAVVQCLAATGAILGCLAAPIIGGRIGRRPAYFGLCCLSLLVCTILFRFVDGFGPTFLVFCFLAGLTTAAFYGWLPLYLPELFPTRVRATAQGLSYNFGRVFALIGVLGAGRLITYFGGALGKANPRAYPNACATITLIYLVGMVLIWLAPETRGKPLPE
jgi:MFS family permease